MSILIKRAFGVLAFLIGVALGGWFVYNQFWPTEAFKTGFRSIFQLAVPIACLVVGWKWMRYQGKEEGGTGEASHAPDEAAEVSTAIGNLKNPGDTIAFAPTPGDDFAVGEPVFRCAG